MKAAATLPMDVRLMQRGTQLLLGLFVLGCLATAASWVLRAPVLAWRVVRVEGDVTHHSAATLRAQALPQLRGNYLTTDLQAARRVFEAVPWVRRAVVRRVWPHTLVVNLEEHQPVALWERDEGDDQLVNRQGEVFEVNLGDVEDDDLPQLRGPEGSARQVWGLYQQILPVFEAGRLHLARLALTDRGSWQATLEGGAVVELGRGSDAEVAARTQRFVASLPQVEARFGQRALEYADLRHLDGYALRLAGMGTAEPATKRR